MLKKLLHRVVATSNNFEITQNVLSSFYCKHIYHSQPDLLFVIYRKFLYLNRDGFESRLSFTRTPWL